MIPAEPALPPGLRIINGFITLEEEAALIQAVDSATWNTTLARRTQHYGYTYHYKQRGLMVADQIPIWCEMLWPKMRHAELLPQGKIPDQMIVNEYLPGQGITSHIDSFVFGEPIMSLSLGSPCIMEFARAGHANVEVVLQRCSLAIMTGEARSKWTHKIAARKSDMINGKKVARTRRVSLTFRFI